MQRDKIIRIFITSNIICAFIGSIINNKECTVSISKPFVCSFCSHLHYFPDLVSSNISISFLISPVGMSLIWVLFGGPERLLDFSRVSLVKGRPSAASSPPSLLWHFLHNLVKIMWPWLGRHSLVGWSRWGWRSNKRDCELLFRVPYIQRNGIFLKN